jgi:hypothetical protein
MTREHLIQTILRSELIQWNTMTKDQLINNLLMERRDVLDALDDEVLDDLVNYVDVAEVWGQSI